MNAMVLIRHEETDLAGRFCGHSDPELNEAGKLRLHSLVEEVVALGVKRIYSSDLRRASQTATAIARRVGGIVELRPSLREIHFGAWEGLSWEEIQERYRAEAQLWVNEYPKRSAPRGETYRDFIARVETEFRQLIAENEDNAFAIVTHRGVIQYALTRFFVFSQADARQRTEKFGALVIVTQSTAREISPTIIEAKPHPPD